MGAADSKHDAGGITRVNEPMGEGRLDDPCLAKLQTLKLSVPLLPISADRALREPGVSRRGVCMPSVNVATFDLDSATTSDLLKAYQSWQAGAAAEVSRNQEDIHHKIDALEALAAKLLHGLNVSSKEMMSCSGSLANVSTLQDTMASLTTEVNNAVKEYEVLFRKIESSGILVAKQGSLPAPESAEVALEEDPHVVQSSNLTSAELSVNFDPKSETDVGPVSKPEAQGQAGN